MVLVKTFTISDTSPASASTAVGASLAGLQVYDALRIDVSLLGGTGGVLDVYLQRKIMTNVWADWVHFTQLSAGSTAKMYSLFTGSSSTITAVGIGNDASPGVALAANTFVGGMPGSAIRLVYVAGSSTSAGGAQLVYVSAFNAVG